MHLPLLISVLIVIMFYAIAWHDPSARSAYLPYLTAEPAPRKVSRGYRTTVAIWCCAAFVFAALCVICAKWHGR
jgi:hypothetical protein